MRIKIAFVQLLPGINLDENLAIGKKACVEAKEKGSDIALFPEMWSDGYYLPQDEKEVNSLAISKDNDFINGFRGLARDFTGPGGIVFPAPQNINSHCRECMV